MVSYNYIMMYATLSVSLTSSNAFMPSSTSISTFTPTSTQSQFQLQRGIISNLPLLVNYDVSLSMAGKKGKKGKKKSKGFGKEVVSSTSTKKVENDTEVQSETTTGTGSTNMEPSTSSVKISAGADALARLRRQEAEKKDEELRAIRSIKEVDAYISEEPDAAVIPEQVAQRMGRRMLPFVGIPLFGVMGTFILFWYLATYRNLEFQPALVAFSTIGVLGVSLLGITYSVMSASWDPETEGSLVGFDEFKTNFGNIQDGLKRTRENAILREKMAGLPEAEIQKAIRDLDKRDQRAKKNEMTMEEKIQKELE